MNALKILILCNALQSQDINFASRAHVKALRNREVLRFVYFLLYLIII
ncbi:unnamed protein product [Brugia pahangi]|uniref:Uncharacterized protein n=1 Tax=Brugia pahangi TaxID=6280 RepID=A0A0N4U0C4_BRUPA|nr:unnamed protein product [Brugia pahangi]